MCQADAPAGLAQPLACSDAGSEQTHGFFFEYSLSCLFDLRDRHALTYNNLMSYHYMLYVIICCVQWRELLRHQCARIPS